MSPHMREMPASQTATGRASSQLHQGTLYLRTLFRGSWGAEHGIRRKPENSELSCRCVSVETEAPARVWRCSTLRLTANWSCPGEAFAENRLIKENNPHVPASSRHACACACSAADYFPTGIESSKIEPSASDLTSRNLPPWFSATVKQMASPNPMPPDFVVKNGSNIRFRSPSTRSAGREVVRRGTIGGEALLRSRRIGITRALALAVRKRTRGSPRSRDRDLL